MPDHLAEHRNPVDDRCIDHLAAARGLAFDERREDADEQEHRAAAEVAD